MGINPTSRVSNAKTSFTKLPIKSSSFTKVVSLAKINSSTNKSSDNELLFISEKKSITKSSVKSGFIAKKVEFTKPNRKKIKSVLPRQDALEPAIRRLAIVPPLISLLVIAPTIIIDSIIKV